MSMPRQSSVTVTTVGLDFRVSALLSGSALPTFIYSDMLFSNDCANVFSSFSVYPRRRLRIRRLLQACSQAISFIYDSGVKPSSFIFRNHLRTPRRWRSRSSIKFLRWSSSFGADCVCGPCMRRRTDRRRRGLAPLARA